MGCTNTREHGVMQQRAIRSPERGVGHYWYCVLLAPWQQIMFNGAVSESCKELD